VHVAFDAILFIGGFENNPYNNFNVRLTYNIHMMIGQRNYSKLSLIL